MDTTTSSPNLLNSQQPEILSSINELSEFSTALSAFLHDFHDLRNHITSITSAIDAQLPPQLLLNTNAAITTEAIFAERNPNGTEKSNGQLKHANDDDEDLRKVVEETSDKLEGFDVLMKEKEGDILVSEEDIDIWKMIEDIDCHNNALSKKTKMHKKVDIINKIGMLLKKDPQKSDSFRKPEEIDKLKHDEGTDISMEEDRETHAAQQKKKHEETDVSKEDEEIDMSKESDEITISKKKPREETDASKKLVENDILIKPEEMDIPKEPQEETDATMKTVRIDILNKPEEIDVSKKPLEETDASKKPVKVDILDKPEEIGISKKPLEETDASKKEIDVLNQPEEVYVSNKPEEIDVPKKPDEIDVSNKPQEIDVSNKPQEIDVSKKPEEIDVSKKADEIDASKKPAIAELEFWFKRKNAHKIKKHAAKKQQLSDLKSIRRCLETHKIDPSKFLPVVKMNENIEQLEKVINELDLKSNEEKSTLKRKEKETEFLKLSKPEENDVSKKPDEIDVSNKPEEIDVSNKPEEIDVSKKADDIDASKKPAISVLEFLCKYRNAKKVRKHVVAHISELSSLHQEIAMALKLGRNPAMLVLDCICSFFLPTTRGHYHGEFRHQQLVAKFSKEKEKHVAARKASVLILECFVMISGDGIEIRKDDKEYAEHAAIDWRERIINEGGLKYMEAVDARGLLLFISGFGIPDGVFSNEDFSDLIRASNVKEISNALRHSTILIPKLPEVIDWMVKNNLEIEAADIAYTFGLEDKCYPETILMTFLHNKVKDTQSGSSLQVNVAMMQQLSDLKSLRRCLETHKLDPSKFLPGVKMNEKIEQLEKVINELDLKSNEEKSTLKRKEKETESSKLNKPEEIHVSKKPNVIDVSNKPEKIDVLTKPEEIDVPKKGDEIDASKKPAIAELEFWCKRMRAEKIKKHVVAHISEMNSLHQEIAKALKLASNPAKLVLDSMAHFNYRPVEHTTIGNLGASRLQRKFHKEKKKQIALRQASVLILECFVMISGDGIEIRKDDKEYAEHAAIDWRERIINEGGLKYMEAVDARGLLLFISGFGIPDGVFSNEDFSDLIRASNVKEISSALRHSTILIPKLPEVIDWMVKNNLEIEAADIAYTFGLEDKCHPETILMTFLHNKVKDTQSGSSLQVNAATMQQLSDLKSIRRCLESHKIDPSKFLPGVKVNEKIEQLEKVINELDLKSNAEKSTLKRKENETESSKLNKPEEIDVSKKPDEIDVSNKPREIDVSNKPEEIDVLKKGDEIDTSKKPAIAVLEFLCKRMCPEKIKKHVVAHLSEMNSLHQEIAKALKLARNPAKLVLDSIANFSYRPVEHTTIGNLGASRLQRKFHKKKKKQIALRQASVLILECFVMISGDGIEITKKDKEYAENAAIDWRKRMIQEGGLIYMEAVDARGLLLFISGFGIPDGVFSNEDFSDLIKASNVKEISHALRHSTILIPKLPEVIDWMVTNNLEIEAADIAYTFGLEDKCHPETILMTFLHNKIKDTQNGSSLQVNAATMRQLSDLKSIRRCLETHKIDPSKFLPGVKINEKIEQLEKVINELDLKSNEEKSTLKSKEKETESSKLNKPEEIRVSKKPDEIDVSNKPEKVDVSNKPEEIHVSKKDDEIDASKKPAIAALEFWCKRMNSKKIKKHVVAHISEMKSLHQEIAKALKLARNPAKLVLQSIKDFSYLPVEHTTMGNLGTSRFQRKFQKKKKQIPTSEASVLILECFLMISGDGIEITKKDKEYAENAAIDWRKRMIEEGGLIMEAVDARGLLLFISGFGIPDGVFSNEDFSDLIRASNVKEISNALRHSTILIPKLPEVIDWMVKNNLEIEAADIAYTFGLEDKCHPETILMTFLHNKIKDTQDGSSLQVNAATTQQLSDLKSIRRCLETHNIDPSKFLPGVKINETIEQLEKVVNELDLKSNEEKSTLKRKEKETEFSKGLDHQQQAKRICSSHENLNPHDHYGIPPYNLSTQPNRSCYFDRNHPNNNYVTTYSASSVFSAPVPPPNIISSGLAASYGPCVYGGPVADPMPNTNNPWPYGAQPYSIQSQAYHPYPYFPGMPDHSLPGGFFIRGVPSSDLYRFADTVVERGSHRGPRAAGSNTRR